MPQPLANPGGVEAVGEPQRRGGGNATGSDAVRALGHRGRAAAAGHVVPDRAAAAGDGHRVQIDTAAPFSFGGRGSARRGRSALAARLVAGAAAAGQARRRPPRCARPRRSRPGRSVAGPVAYTVQVSMDGTTWGAPVAQGAGSHADDGDRLRAGAGASSSASRRPAPRPSGEQWAIAQVRVYQAAANISSSSRRTRLRHRPRLFRDRVRHRRLFLPGARRPAAATSWRTRASGGSRSARRCSRPTSRASTSSGWPGPARARASRSATSSGSRCSCA